MFKPLFLLTQSGWGVRLKQQPGMSILSKGKAKLIIHWADKKFETAFAELTDVELQILSSNGIEKK